MKDIIEDIIVLLGYVVALVFVGWVYYQTKSASSFALLLILPFLKSKDKS